MSDTRFLMPRLNNQNYAEWSLRMEAILIRKGLWTNIVSILINPKKSDGSDKSITELETERTGTIAARDVVKMAEARAELILCVEAGQLAHMTSPDPMLVWENLERMHRAHGFATSLALRRQFLTAKKSPEETMEAWIGRIQAMVLRMEHAKIPVSDQDKILAYTMGLPSTYETVIVNFDATPPAELTVEKVITRLLNEETRQISDTTRETPDPTPSSENAFAARRTSELTCFFCDKKGHLKSNCPDRLAWLKSRDTSQTAATAFCDPEAPDDLEYAW